MRPRYITAQAAAEKSEPRYLTVQGAADYLSVCAKTVREWIAAGVIIPAHLPTINGSGANRFMRIDRQDLDSLMQKRKASG